jgi:hypothetical protein
LLKYQNEPDADADVKRGMKSYKRQRRGSESDEDISKLGPKLDDLLLAALKNDSEEESIDVSEPFEPIKLTKTEITKMTVTDLKVQCRRLGLDCGTKKQMTASLRAYWYGSDKLKSDNGSPGSVKKRSRSPDRSQQRNRKELTTKEGVEILVEEKTEAQRQRAKQLKGRPAHAPSSLWRVSYGSLDRTRGIGAFRPPSLYSGACYMWEERRYCRYGNYCKFAHS